MSKDHASGGLNIEKDGLDGQENYGLTVKDFDGTPDGMPQSDEEAMQLLIESDGILNDVLQKLREVDFKPSDRALQGVTDAFQTARRELSSSETVNRDGSQGIFSDKVNGFKSRFRLRLLRRVVSKVQGGLVDLKDAVQMRFFSAQPIDIRVASLITKAVESFQQVRDNIDPLMELSAQLDSDCLLIRAKFDLVGLYISSHREKSPSPSRNKLLAMLAKRNAGLALLYKQSRFLRKNIENRMVVVDLLSADLPFLQSCLMISGGIAQGAAELAALETIMQSLYELNNTLVLVNAEMSGRNEQDALRLVGATVFDELTMRKLEEINARNDKLFIEAIEDARKRLDGALRMSLPSLSEGSAGVIDGLFSLTISTSRFLGSSSVVEGEKRGGGYPINAVAEEKIKGEEGEE
ncbi:hypothetical protein HYV57_02945 [Candidatus Peregrinibacteria bacterium]|nr:hypothetical protein [Candidatus Peregrinibacteria bacterium]